MTYYKTTGNSARNSVTTEMENEFVEEQIYVCVPVQAQLIQMCPTLCDPMDCSLLGSTVHEIPQARIVEMLLMSL